MEGWFRKGCFINSKDSSSRGVKPGAPERGEKRTQGGEDI